MNILSKAMLGSQSPRWLPRPLSCLVALVFCATACGGDAPADAMPTESEHGDFQLNVTVDTGSFHRGANDFVAQATDAMGNPAQLQSVVAMMPAHGHYAAAPTITPSGNGFQVTNLVLPMAGSWQITLNFATSALQDDALVLTFVP